MNGEAGWLLLPLIPSGLIHYNRKHVSCEAHRTILKLCLPVLHACWLTWSDLPRWGCRYWHFVAGGEDCPAAGAGRIFVEPRDGAGYLLLSEPQQLSLLLDSLETRGPREKVKHICFTAYLAHHETQLRAALDNAQDMRLNGSQPQVSALALRGMPVQCQAR